MKSLYFITLGEALRRVKPSEFADLMIEQEWVEEPTAALGNPQSYGPPVPPQVWYNRHQVIRPRIERGKTKIVEKETFLSETTCGGPFSATFGREPSRPLRKLKGNMVWRISALGMISSWE